MKKELKDVWPGDIRVDESFWGQGTSERIYEWLANEYDPETMPTLALAQVTGKPGLSLLGWEWEGTKFPPLIEQIFGKGFAIHRMDQFEAERRVEDTLRDDLGEYGQGKGHA